MDMIKIAAIGLVAGIFSIVIRKTNPELSVIIGLSTGVIILVMTLDYLKEAVDFIRDFAEKYSGVYGGVALVVSIL